jgi:anti-anti-sigma regulatory factor
MGMVPGVPQYSLSTTRVGRQAVLAVAGELDLATADEFAASVRERLAAGLAMIC